MSVRRSVDGGRPSRIVLIGPMGAGKSTLARSLSTALDYACVDIDSEVERVSGMRIHEIFKHQGEAAFRQAEAQLLSEMLGRDQIVVATGGGCVLSANNRACIAEDCWVVYLSVSAEEAIARCELVGESRPLLNACTSLSAWKSAFSERESYYHALADVTIETDNQPVDLLLSDILARWEVVCE